jgi:ABC-type branched-subunit amino acid transport system substrate-binding protein
MRHLVIAVAAWLVGLPALAQIVIGQTAGFTGPVAAGVKETTEGARLYLDHVNAQGGIDGQKIELVSVDDRFDPRLTAQTAETLITQHHPVALFLTRGTTNTQAVLPLLTRYQVPLVAPSTGAMLLHQPVQPWVFNVRAPYQREAERAVELLASMGLTRIGVAHNDDSFGNDAAIGALRGFDNVKLKPAFHTRFDRTHPDMAETAADVQRFDVQALMVFGSAAAVAQALHAVRDKGSHATVVTLSNNASQGFVQMLGADGRGTIVTQVFPDERSMSAPLVKEATDLARAKGLHDLSPAMLEGYAGAKVLVAGLQRCGPHCTGAQLRDALEHLERYDLGGLEIRYGAHSHSGLEFADLSIVGADGRFTR